jgi:5-methylcytosine-specific restriction enzyme subunit McrC
VFDRKTERYKEAILISKLLLLNYRPDITGGRENVIAILFDMNKLWEEFVYRRLKKEEITLDISVKRHQSEDFWNSEKISKPKTIRPDIVIKKKSETIVVDTKWKIIENFTPDDEDLRQMFVYNLYWKCNKSILLYPAPSPSSCIGKYYNYEVSDNPERQCAVETVCVLDDNQNALNKNLGANILKRIL